MSDVFQELNGWYFWDESGANKHGPFESMGQAQTHCMAYGHSLTSGAPMPRVTARYKHENGNEYTVIAISNEHSEREEYQPRVVYQGDNGRVWDKPLIEFMSKMKLIANPSPAPMITQRGFVRTLFTDAEGRVCYMQESSAMCGGLIIAAMDDIQRDRHPATGEELPGGFRVSIEQVREIVGYLIFFVQNGTLPERKLPDGYLFGAVEGDERLDYLRLLALTSHPETWNFANGVVSEAAHQEQRWGKETDEGKGPNDWVFLVGYLMGKALEAHKQGDPDRVRHHCVAAGAVIYHFFRYYGLGDSGTSFQPGISEVVKVQ